MLGLRLNKLGAPSKQGFSLRRLFRPGAYGFLGALSNLSTIRQTYNAPATAVTAASDPVGLMLNTVGDTDVVNLLLWTDDISNAEYTKVNATVSPNVAVGPNGSPIADKLIESAIAADHAFRCDATITAGSAVTFFVRVKPAGRDRIRILVSDTATSNQTLAFFDAATGTLTQAVQQTGAATAGVASITADAEGYYLCRISCVIDGSSTTARCRVSLSDNSDSITYLGNGSSGIYLSGIQCQLGSIPRPYQPNAACLGGSNRRTGGSNLLLLTENITDFTGMWSGTDATVTYGQIATPEGALRGSLVTEGVAGTAIYSQSFTFLAGSTLTIAIRFKRGGPTPIQWNKMQLNSSGGTTRVWADIQNGIIGTNNPSAGTHTFVSAALTAESDSWYCLSLTITVATDTTASLNFCSASANNSNTRVNNATYYVCKAQANLGTLATYSRNMEVVGGLLTSLVPYQATSANRGTLARRPRSGIRNRVASNQMAGAVAGSPGTPTTDWSYLAIPAGITRTIVGVGTEDGIRYSEIRFAGTTTDASGISIGLGASAALTSETWTNSYYHKLVAGSVTGVTNWQVGIIENTSGGVFVSGAFYNINAPVSASLSSQRQVATRTLNGGATVGQNSGLYKVAIPTSTAIDFTIRIGEPQIEKASSVSALQHITSATNITEDNEPSVYHTFYDGTSDYMDTGVQSFGRASLAAVAGQAWTIFGDYRTLSPASAAVVVGKNGGSDTLGTLQLLVRGSGGGNALSAISMGGTQTNLSATNTGDGVFHTWALRWDGTTLTGWVDSGVGSTVPPGSAADVAEAITISARTASAPTRLFSGHNDVWMLDRALSDTEVTALMANLNLTYRFGL